MDKTAFTHLILQWDQPECCQSADLHCNLKNWLDTLQAARLLVQLKDFDAWPEKRLQNENRRVNF